MTALLLTLSVLVGQSGLLLAVESSVVPSRCTKCPCGSDKPSCCVEKTDSQEPSETPGLPVGEQRLLQPASIDSTGSDGFAFPAIVPAITAARAVVLAEISSVPLFLRHLAILI